MLEEFIRYWWLPTLRGALLAVFGLVTLFLANNMSLSFAEALVRVSLVVLFAVYLGLSGTLTILAAVLIRHASHRWMYIAHGLLLAGLCAVILFVPQVRLETLAFLTVAHAAVNGLGEARIAASLKHHRGVALILSVIAAVSLSAALALALLRNAPVTTMTAALGAYAFFYGACLIYFGLYLRRSSVPAA